MGKKYTSLVVFGGLLSIIITAYFLKSITNLSPTVKNNNNEKLIAFTKFTSDEEFKKYLNNSQNNNYLKREDITLEAGNNYSQTNIQVINIDEPDIAKTNGENIFFSTQGNFFIKPLPIPLSDNVSSSPAIINEEIIPNSKTFIINPQNGKLSINSEINTNGELLVANNVLISFDTNYPNNKVSAFNVADSKNPLLLWEKNLENTQIVTSRLYENKIYLITANYPDYDNPCPFSVFNNKIACTEIYHPNYQINSNQITNISKINIATGEIEKSVSFIASYNTKIYMSNNNIYVAYQIEKSYQDFYLDFFRSDDAKSILPEELNQKIANLEYYDISNEAKYTEINSIIENYKTKLKFEDRQNLEQKVNNQIDKYAQKRARDLSITQIVKIDNNNLNILANSNVPGRILNQFSLDEFNNNLRIATTVNNNYTNSDSQNNDLYILDNNLNKIGEYLNFGEGERIYSVRFIENKAYIVTFKQIDPFFIFDLSDPKNPQKSGELKIPGYSSYLHQLDENLILGVGKENDFIKLSLFDVSSNNPKELSSFILENEYYSEILDNHKAFLINKNKKQFFIPSFNASYIFGYENNELKMLRKINQQNLKRALYIDNYYYFLSDEKVSSYELTNFDLIDDLNFF